MRRAALILAAVVAAVLSLATPAAFAAEPKQASKGLKAYGLDWIEAIPPDALPPTRYAVCIVDSGVAITPDTPPDNPNGPILRRLSIDGGSGEPQGTLPEQLHGTRMAMAAIAPRNRWGTVGMFPGGRIISVRAMVEGETTFRVASYARAISTCLKLTASVPLAAINLSVSCATCQPTASDIAMLSETVARAADRGVAVFGAAGNTRGAVQFPANQPGITAVSAGGNRGKLCKYSAFGPETAVVAPACPSQSADPISGAFEPKADGGTSVASLQVATLASLLKTMRSDATPSVILEWIRRAQNASGPQGLLDGRLAAGHAGQTRVVRAANKALGKRRSG